MDPVGRRHGAACGTTAEPVVEDRRGGPEPFFTASYDFVLTPANTGAPPQVSSGGEAVHR